jgi:hypothetical protein
MGTRHLILVQLDNEYKIAQYGQWDGYPTGTGKDIVNILKEIDLKVLKTKLREYTLLVPEDMAFNEDIEKMNNEDFQFAYPELSRNTGANILKIVYNTEKGLILRDSTDFANNSLYCEWVYVLNLDNNTLEVHKGFNTDTNSISWRFNKKVVDTMGYRAVQLVKTYPISLLSESTMEKLENDLNKGE